MSQIEPAGIVSVLYVPGGMASGADSVPEHVKGVGGGGGGGGVAPVEVAPTATKNGAIKAAAINRAGIFMIPTSQWRQYRWRR
jgi:hypothetical protein